MVTIKDGYAGEPFVIKIYKSDNHTGKAEIFTDMFDNYKEIGLRTSSDEPNSSFRTEVLHYATLQELLQMRDEINKVMKEIIGV